MTKINFVTSFNETLLKTTGIHLLKSIKENLESSINLTCYHHDCKLDAYSLPEFTYKDLHKVKEHQDFLERYKDHDGTENGQIAYNDKLDALRWSHKVFALTEEAFSLIEKNKQAGWLIWIDIDSYLQKRLTKENILSMLNDKVDIIYNPEEPFFMAFNLDKQPAIDILSDLRGAFMLGEVTKYREWHDYYVLERLLNIYQAHGMKIEKVPAIYDYFYHFRGNPDFSKVAIRNEKGDRVFPLSDNVSPDIKPNRYQQIVQIMKKYKPTSVIETGTWNGGRAIEMALTAFEYSNTFTYYGYDLFEDATVQTDFEEFNGKAHNKLSAVQNRLKEFAEHVKENKNKNFIFELHKGNTRETLKDQGEWFDMAFIGGGNSIKTVAHDYECVKKTPIIMLDHYFRQDDDKLEPNEAYQGVNKVWDSLKGNKEIRKNILPSGDKVLNGGFTHLMILLNDKKLDDIPADLKRVPIVVNPRDCVPKDYIRNNIKDNLKLIDKNKFIDKCRIHDEHAIVISGGPNMDYNELKETMKKYPNAFTMCVKHAYPNLIKNGIKPNSCILLDPRSIDGESTHGIKRKDLLKDIVPETKFLVASMTDPSVTNYLIEKKADIWGWHAFSESLRDDEERKTVIRNNQVKIRDDIGLPAGATLITGGTCAAMRAIGMLHTIGFRSIHLFGFECSLASEPTEAMKKETTGADDEPKRPKYFQVSLEEQSFWTTGELLAMAQDCEKTFADSSMGINFHFYGKNSLVSAIWEQAVKRQTLPSYRKLLNVQ